MNAINCVESKFYSFSDGIFRVFLRVLCEHLFCCDVISLYFLILGNISSKISFCLFININRGRSNS